MLGSTSESTIDVRGNNNKRLEVGIISLPLDRGGGAVNLKLIGKSAAEAGNRDRPEQKLMNRDRSSCDMASKASQKYIMCWSSGRTPTVVGVGVGVVVMVVVISMRLGER